MLTILSKSATTVGWRQCLLSRSAWRESQSRSHISEKKADFLRIRQQVRKAYAEQQTNFVASEFIPVENAIEIFSEVLGGPYVEYNTFYPQLLKDLKVFFRRPEVKPARGCGIAIHVKGHLWAGVHEDLIKRALKVTTIKFELSPVRTITKLWWD